MHLTFFRVFFLIGFRNHSKHKGKGFRGRGVPPPSDANAPRRGRRRRRRRSSSSGDRGGGGRRAKPPRNRHSRHPGQVLVGGGWGIKAEGGEWDRPRVDASSNKAPPSRHNSIVGVLHADKNSVSGSVPFSWDSFPQVASGAR